MLTQQSSTVVLRSRIFLASSILVAGGVNSNNSAVPQHKASMSTPDGSVRASEESRQQRPRQPSIFFPLGYKEAAYQWVSSEF